MVRTQIQLTEEQARRLKALSASTEQSMAALIRSAVDQFLSESMRDRDLLYHKARAVIGKHTADASDVARHHDRYLREGFEA